MSDSPARAVADATAGLRTVTVAPSPPPTSGLSRFPLVLLACGGACAVLLVCSFALHQLDSVDFWWHLRLGQYITELREVPVTDPFTFTAKGHHYIDSHWLFQVGLWAVYRAGGVNGVILAVAGIAVLTWGLAAAVYWRASAFGVGLLALGLGIITASERYIPRPDLLSLCFLALTVLLVTRFRATGTKFVYALPVTGLVWANIHGLWILGPIVAAVYVLADAVVPRLKVPDGWRASAMPGPQLRVLAGVGAGMVVAAFVSPQPLAQALYPLTLFQEIQGGGSWVESAVTELASPFADAHWGVATWAFIALATMVLAGFVANRRRLDVPDAVLTLLFAYLAFTARRNMALFAVVAVPVAIRQWADRGGEVPASRPGRQMVLAGAASLAALAVAWGAATDRLATRQGALRRFGLGLHEALHPGRLGDFIRASGTPGPIWNVPGIGGYLAWRFWPERETYIDGRWEVYGDDFMRTYARTITQPDVWEQAGDAYGIQAAVITHRRADFGPLLRYLAASPRWALCYADAAAALFVRRTADTADYVARYAVRLDAAALPTPLPAGHTVLWDDASLGRPHFEKLAHALRRWPARPADATETLLLANFLFTLEQDAQAEAWFRRSLAIAPQDFTAHASLGYLLAQGGRVQEALQHYRTATRVRPWELEPWLGFGNTALRAGDLQAAHGAFTKAARVEPRSAGAWFGLGRVTLLLGDAEGARVYLRQLQTIAPDAPEVAALEAALREGA